MMQPLGILERHKNRKAETRKRDAEMRKHQQKMSVFFHRQATKNQQNAKSPTGKPLLGNAKMQDSIADFDRKITMSRTDTDDENFKIAWKLWMPEAQEIEDSDEEDGNDPDEPPIMILPLEEMLRKIKVKDVRTTAVIAFMLYLVFMATLFTSLYLEMQMEEAGELEHAVKETLHDA
eukprot:CAMPEP_0118870368 /NCGR_PEP_ID=MMETSP1163-20130328/13367_1 /TAXON_ID=124430 /ORGANISM="Phaeomonas parva, Strain CCMP2877" /LENGTH=176 /DNA_ID=CAMNT_0006805365 /DNA_START=45 /DNA_END=572 /DNA_ORIENTATION=-